MSLVEMQRSVVYVFLPRCALLITYSDLEISVLMLFVCSQEG